MLRFLAGLFCLLILQPTHIQAEKLNIAVNNLSAKNVDASAAEIISDRLRVELLNSDAYRVMERSEMATVLKEQGFQKSGACDDASCLIEIGQLLGVQKMISGSVGKIGKDFYSITLRMVNIRTAEIEHSIVYDFEGEMKELVSEGVKKSVEMLMIEINKGIVENDNSVKVEKSKVVLTPDQEKAKRKKVSKWIRRITFGGVAAGTLVAGILAHKDAQELHETYMDQEGYNQAALDAAYEDVEKKKTMRNVFYIIAGASAVGLTISIPF